MSRSASQMTPAVMPLPHDATTPRRPARIASACSLPTAASSVACSVSGDGSVVYVSGCAWPAGVYVRVCRKAVKGSEKECGMCPEGSPARGSGSLPVNLVVRGGERAGTNAVCASLAYRPWERASSTSSVVSDDRSDWAFCTI